MKASISEIVGHAINTKGKEISIYRALRPLLCAHCGNEIKEGDLFTRRKLGSIRISPRCQECSPFRQINITNSSSPLIDFLLKPEQVNSKVTKLIGSADRALISKEVERRLGPALARCRKRRG